MDAMNVYWAVVLGVAGVAALVAVAAVFLAFRARARLERDALGGAGCGAGPGQPGAMRAEMRLFAEPSSDAEIRRVVASMKDIADQANLLALNIAIEAAKAGRRGERFAVAADDARRLAQSSKEASNQSSELLERLQGVSRASTLSSPDSGSRKISS
ncbi:methyl-accepting chemotaxis protein [Chromobacterium phragmitis]